VLFLVFCRTGVKTLQVTASGQMTHERIECWTMFHHLVLSGIYNDSCSVAEQFFALLSYHHCLLCIDMLSVLGIGK